jgi:hypothetical protein
VQGWGVRFEQSRAGRVLLSVVMLVLIGCVVLWNLPPGRPRDEVRPVVGRVLLPLGLDQDWAVFAPDPRSFSVGLHARVVFDDGHEELWFPPTDGVALAPYRSYRWQKYVERVRADDYAGLWDRTAHWVAEQHGEGVRRVVLVRTFRDALVPGTPGPRKARGAYEFFVLDLP